MNEVGCQYRLTSHVKCEEVLFSIYLQYQVIVNDVILLFVILHCKVNVNSSTTTVPYHDLSD